MSPIATDHKRLAALLRIATEAARAGGDILLARYGQNHDIVHKGQVNLVTEADLASEQLRDRKSVV